MAWCLNDRVSYFICMEELKEISNGFQDPPIPNMTWESSPRAKIRDESHQIFISFKEFISFPINQFQQDTIEKAQNLLGNAPFEDLFPADKEFEISDLPTSLLISLHLQKDGMLLEKIPENMQPVKYVWCLSQCLENNPTDVMLLCRKRLLHPIPFDDFMSSHAIMLLLNKLLDHFQPSDLPPFTSDEFEVIFTLAYCADENDLHFLARFIVKKMLPLINSSRAAHLLFRRMLPYCSMDKYKGRKYALYSIETMLEDQERFPSIASTWISLHPYCVASSNNVLVYLQRKGLVTYPMKSLIKQLQYMNSKLKKGKIKLPDETRMSLPRSLWRVPFPPPRSDIDICNDTCKKISKTLSSGKAMVRNIIIVVFLIALLFYSVYLNK